MADSPRTASALINRGVAAERAGDLAGARQLFAHALLLDPASDVAWLWYATVAEQPGERRYALTRAIQIDPESAARAALADLAGVEPIVPAELADLAKPPLPPAFTSRPKGLPQRLAPLNAGRRVMARPQRIDGAGRIRALRPRARTHDATTGAGRSRFLAPVAALLLVLAIVAGWFIWLRPPDDTLTIAFAGALSGPFSEAGRESANSVQLYLDEVNQNGGIDGRPVRLATYDDQDDPDLARQRAEEIVADGHALVVIGHDTSATSLAAGEVYAAAGIAAITGSATADDVTADRPWYFRTAFTNRAQGALLATYVDHLFKSDTASLVYDDDVYGQSLHSGFAEQFAQTDGALSHVWPLGADNRDQTIQRIVDDLKADPAPGVLVLAVTDEHARDLIVALRDQGVDVPMIGSDTLGTRTFPRMFAGYPAEQAQPGHYTDGLYAVTPYLYDAGGGAAASFLERYQTSFAARPDGWAVKSYDAAIAAVRAIDAADVAGVAEPNAEARQRVRDQLAAIDSLEVAIPSLEGPLYFDASRSVPQAIWIARFAGGDLEAAPEQYLPVVDPYRYDIDAEIASGAMSEIDGRYFSPTSVVYTGIDLNEVTSLDTTNETFAADFFVWFRYLGSDALTDVQFANAVNPDLSLGEPVESGSVNGLNYRLYRVQGEFKEALDFLDYPWDQHQLTIRLQNATLRTDQAIYVVDQIVQDQPADERLRSGLDVTKSINGIPNWEATGVQYFQDTISSDSALGDSRLSDAAGAVVYSQFVTEITIARDVRSFLIKNLLPLALLGLVTYISLFFPAEQASSRIGFSITAILTSAVMLGAVSNQLPEIGYTVAIEWGFYVYIALAAVLVVINMTIDRLVKQKRMTTVRHLEVFARVLYPIVVLVVAVAYARVYA